MATRIESGNFLQTKHGWEPNKLVPNDDIYLISGYKKTGGEIHYLVRSHPDYTDISRSKGEIKRINNTLEFELEQIARINYSDIDIANKPAHGILPITDLNSYILYYRPTPSSLLQPLKMTYTA